MPQIKLYYNIESLLSNHTTSPSMLSGSTPSPARGNSGLKHHVVTGREQTRAANHGAELRSLLRRLPQLHIL